MTGTFKITDGLLERYTGYDEEIVIPADVTEISSMACFANDSVKKVVIPGSVKKIGQFAFFSCGNLSDLTLEEGVETIGMSAFSGTALKEVHLPASATEVDDKAFDDGVSVIRGNKASDTAEEKPAENEEEPEPENLLQAAEQGDA